MFRTIDIVMICALIAGASWTFKVKYDSEVAKQELVRLERRLQIEREAIDVMKADWSLLTSPDRLEKLVSRHEQELGLKPAEPGQVGSYGEIPARAAFPEPEMPEAEPASRQAAAPDNSVVTGSVGGVEPAAPVDGASEEEDFDLPANPMTGAEE